MLVACLHFACYTLPALLRHSVTGTDRDMHMPSSTQPTPQTEEDDEKLSQKGKDGPDLKDPKTRARKDKDAKNKTLKKGGAKNVKKNLKPGEKDKGQSPGPKK